MEGSVERELGVSLRLSIRITMGCFKKVKCSALVQKVYLIGLGLAVLLFVCFSNWVTDVHVGLRTAPVGVGKLLKRPSKDMG